MIDVSKFIDEVTGAVRTGETEAVILAEGTRAIDNLSADLDDALVNPTHDDVQQIRQLLEDVKARLKAIDFDGFADLKITLTEANAVRANLVSQIDDILLEIGVAMQLSNDAKEIWRYLRSKGNPPRTYVMMGELVPRLGNNENRVHAAMNELINKGLCEGQINSNAVALRGRTDSRQGATRIGISPR
jgi:hypothetical protein